MTVRLAQIGIGHVHAAGKTKVARATPGAELAGIFEPDPALRAAKSGVVPYDGVHWFESVDEILNDGPQTYLANISRQCSQIHTAVNQSYVAYPIESALPA